MTGDEIRQAFLNFFQDRGHKIIPSSSLVPHKHAAMLLTQAGMVQIKPYFLGLEIPPSRRLASCQKCFRASDIDSVGDSKHLTFFEMLGNFSVGDYFKEEAISWAWEFVTQYLKLPQEQLWVTIYLDDDEAFAYWREVGVPAEKILRFGEEDNFWGPVGGPGPCGPCSEIHYDQGEDFGCGRPECKPNCECGRFSEIWNLVFTVYMQDRRGQRSPLPKPNIDTGMGLERTLAAIQGKSSPYETDLFSPLVGQICQLSGKEYGQDGNADRAIRIVAEHSRGIAFLIADGVMPSNEGRGYVLRRVLRRASLFGRRLGWDKPFLGEIAEVAIDKMGRIYPELRVNRDLIKEVIRAEEEKFIATLDTGLNSINATSELISKELHRFASTPAFQQMQKSLQQLATQLAEDLQPTQQIKVPPAFQQAFGQYQRVAEQLGKAIQPIQQIKLDPAFLRALGQYQRAAEQLGKAVQPIQKIELDPVFKQVFGQHQKLAAGLAKAIQPMQQIATISGNEVFKLHDTFGFPKELTAEISREKGLSIDWEGFQAEMEKQRKRARVFQMQKSVTLKPGERKELNIQLAPKKPGIYDVRVGDLRGTIVVLPPGLLPEFIGYETTTSQSKIIALRVKGQGVQPASHGDEVDIVLDKTPFYGEMGGQAGDSGEISNSKGKVVITNTMRTPSDVIIHQGKVIEGSISFGDEVEAEVDSARRLDIARNHTATHLLQAALRQTLGDRVYQKGSLVEPERFRFDFSHLAPIAEEQLTEVQRQVNEWIRQNSKVEARDLPYDQAIAEGAIALFEEKYGEMVRVMEIGEPAISKELCGGTHVSSTGEIGIFLITSESGIGTGLHRIEAVTGRKAESLIESRLIALQSVAREVEGSLEEVPNKVKSLVSELEAERKRSLSVERELSRKIAEALPEQVEQVSGVTVLAVEVLPLSMPILREMGDIVRDRLKSAVVVLATVHDDKPNFLAMVTPDLVAKGFHAGDIINQVAKVTGGGGGGKASMAQAGGKDASKIDEALKLAKSVIASRISCPSMGED